MVESSLKRFTTPSISRKLARKFRHVPRKVENISSSKSRSPLLPVVEFIISFENKINVNSVRLESAIHLRHLFPAISCDSFSRIILSISFLDLGPRSRQIAIPYKERYNITEYLFTLSSRFDEIKKSVLLVLCWPYRQLTDETKIVTSCFPLATIVVCQGLNGKSI